MVRCAVVLLVVASQVAPALAQPVNLGETAAVGDSARYLIELELNGSLIVSQEGRRQSIRLQAKARHAFAEKVMAVGDGMATISARQYASAAASAVVAGEKSERQLPDDRKLILARRRADGLFCYAPSGPLSRDDLDLVTEHFNPQCLPGLLPGKIVKVGDTWSVGDNAAQAACLFEGVVKNALTGKLIAVKDGVATFSIEGTAEGIEHGAKVALTITATGTYDAAVKRITGLTWKQKDVREQGTVNPASEVEVTVTLRREPLAAEPKELVHAAIPARAGTEPPAKDTMLRYVDPQGRYRITHDRDWYVTGQTDTHLVLRLIEKGEFGAQATVTAWRKVEAGQHSPAGEFKKAVADTPGWVAGKTIAEGELPVDGGRWLFRVAIEGKIEDRPAVQTFYLLAGPKGDQVAVTVITKPEGKKAARELELVRSIEPGRK